MLRGRLGLETARLPHSDRHGLVSLDRGRLTVEDGCLTFRLCRRRRDAGRPLWPAAPIRVADPARDLDPASATMLCACSRVTGWGWWRSVRTACASTPRSRCCPTSPASPAPRPASGRTRGAAGSWWRAACTPCVLGEVLPHRDIAVLRGIEGARMKETYRIAAREGGGSAGPGGAMTARTRWQPMRPTKL